jgi:hypothetical protein
MSFALCSLYFVRFSIGLLKAQPQKVNKEQSSKHKALDESDNYSSYLLNNSAAFVPPNPKLLDST